MISNSDYLQALSDKEYWRKKRALSKDPQERAYCLREFRKKRNIINWFKRDEGVRKAKERLIP